MIRIQIFSQMAHLRVSYLELTKLKMSQLLPVCQCGNGGVGMLGGVM